MSGVRNPQLAAQNAGRHPSLMIRKIESLGIGYRAQQVADEAIEFRVGNKMGRLLIAQGTA
jgi:hypothetical protein